MLDSHHTHHTRILEYAGHDPKGWNRHRSNLKRQSAASSMNLVSSWKQIKAGDFLRQPVDHFDRVVRRNFGDVFENLV